MTRKSVRYPLTHTLLVEVTIFAPGNDPLGFVQSGPSRNSVEEFVKNAILTTSALYPQGDAFRPSNIKVVIR